MLTVDDAWNVVAAACGLMTAAAAIGLFQKIRRDRRPRIVIAGRSIGKSEVPVASKRPDREVRGMPRENAGRPDAGARASRVREGHPGGDPIDDSLAPGNAPPEVEAALQRSVAQAARRANRR